MKKLLTCAIFGLLFFFSPALGQANEDIDTEAFEFPPRITQKAYHQKMNAALDRLIKQWSRLPKSKVQFSANLFFAHGAAVKHFTLDDLKTYASALKEAGVKRIDINIGLAAWIEDDPEIKNKYAALMEHIRNLNLKFALNPEFSATEYTLKENQSPESFSAWSQKALSAYTQIAGDLKPDIFVVIHEPTTMAKRMGHSVSPQEWNDFTRQAIEIVQKASPQTACGAGFLPHEMPYFKLIVQQKKLTYISIDIYALKGLRTFNQIVVIAKKNSKRVYIEETWRNPYFVPDPKNPATLESYISTGIGLDEFQILDQKWLHAITLYAGVMKLETITPFWTQTFFKYVTTDGDALDPKYNLRVLQAIRDGERTETFKAFKKLIETYGTH